jgi:4-nitrophenyl phosphatase
MIKNIKSLILDMDGVLWRASEPIVNLKDIFSRIKASRLKFAFATNNASRYTEDYVDKFADFGIDITKDQVFTSAKATAGLLASRYPDGGNLYIIGMPSMIKTFNDFGFQHSSDGTLAVVASIDFSIDYQKLSNATLKIRSGVPFIGTNPDVSFPTPIGQAPGAGSIIAAIEAASGVKAEIIGKPQPAMFEQAMRYLGTSPAETLVVGDRLETDILGGQNAGCKTCLVLSGVTTQEQAAAWTPHPDLILSDLSELIDEIENR